MTSLRNKQNRLEQLFIDLVEAGRVSKPDDGRESEQKASEPEEVK